MNMRGIFLVCFAVMFWEQIAAETSRPIIGVVLQSTNGSGYEEYGDTFVLSSYVKYLQMAGARVVPIQTHREEEYYWEMFYHLNGVLFPGGSVDLKTSGYAQVGRQFYEMAMQAYDDGDYFPLWGTCNGFELFATISAAPIPAMTPCDASNLTLPLDFLPDFKTGRMFAGISDDLARAAGVEPLTQNYHEFCLSVETYFEAQLDEVYRLIAVNVDKEGLPFVSIIEGWKYPFYAVQFHPEKNTFNWQVGLSVDHSQTAVEFTQYLANFFVQEARINDHHYPSSEAEGLVLIDNYQPKFMGSPDFHNVYFFDLE